MQEKSVYHRLPSFIIGGAPRSGTTSLVYWLNNHPGIYLPEHEGNYFAFGSDVQDYLKFQGKVIASFSKYLEEYSFNEDGLPQITGEKSVSYLYGPWSERVINSILEQHPLGPELKIIFILRQPLDRLFSQYVYNLSFDENLSVDEAIKSWDRRKEEGWVPAYDYIGGSLYAEGLKRYMKAFNDVKVLFFDDLKSDPEKLIKELLDFIGAESNNSGECVGKVQNASGIFRKTGVGKGIGMAKKTALWGVAQKSLPQGMRRWFKEKMLSPYMHKPELDQDFRTKYLDLFMEDITEVESLTGRNLSHWKHR